MSSDRPSAGSFRVGIGHDIHRLQAGGKLMLAGVCASIEMSAVAHSDGDVVLHALVDAILGALGHGDIGELFPNDDPRWQGADSAVFVAEAMRRLRQSRGKVANIDVTIHAERPRLKTFKDEMKINLQRLIECDAVNVKAGTNEGCDAVGRGEAIAADVAILIRLDG
jgi:2-C-methyl-D-erythritol 2,4-cyclodiphosphate synthase